MGFWQCKDGTMVEMIFYDIGDFAKFGDEVKDEDAMKATKEIMEWQRKEIGQVV